MSELWNHVIYKMPTLGERVLVRWKNTPDGCYNYEVDTVLANPKGELYFSLEGYEDLKIESWKEIN